MAYDPKLVQSLFLKVVELPLAERSRLLELECAGDRELRKCIEEFLVAHDESDAFLDQPFQHAILDHTLSENLVTEPDELVADTRIGSYRLIEPLGEGGMGTVWVAEQESPIKRRVALKIIKPGMDSAHVLRRFQQERQALALMDHANIAKILDAGVTGSHGRPFFVMELIKGLPITTYCDELHLSVRERLGLFLSVSRAIEHAHQKGIIHRDIKPSNVLVCIQDGKPVPKIIDFGIAKAVNQRLADETIYTGVGIMIGSLQYMSPEQAELGALDVDTRADVYGLGVLLYELLTGTPPIESTRIQTAPFLETLRMIREQDPPAPSTRLSDSKNGIAILAACRRTEPGKLTREVRGELDWIVMKCLEKDRTRRYESASVLARDIEHHLNDEPVEASPRSTAYRVKKFVRRNRAAVIAASILFVSLAVGVIGTTAGLVWAVDERENARKAAIEEREAKELAQRRLGYVTKYNRVLDSVFQHVNPRRAELEGKSLRVALGERLAQAAAELRAGEIGDPITEAQLQSTLARAQLELGYPEQAIILLTQVRRTREAILGPNDPDTLTAMHHLGLAYTEANRLTEAVELLNDTLTRSKKVNGAADSATLATMNALARAYQAQDRRDEAVELLEKALAISAATHGRNHHDTTPTINNLGAAYLAVGRRAEAEKLLVEALGYAKVEYPAGHPETLSVMENLAVARLELGRVKDALDLTRDGLGIRQDVFGAMNPRTLIFARNLAAMYERAGRGEDAVQLMEGTVKIWDEHFGSRSREALIAKSSLAAALRAANRPEEALRLADATLVAVKEELGLKDRLTIAVLNNAAVMNLETGRTLIALQQCEEADKLAKEVLKPTHPDSLMAAHNRAAVYRGMKRIPEALDQFTDLLERRQKLLGEAHPDTIHTLHQLAETLRAANQREEALPHYREAVRLARLAERDLGLTRRQTLTYMNSLARVCRELRLVEEAVEVSTAVLVTMRKTFGDDDLETIRAMNNLGLAHRANSEPLKAIPLFNEAIERIKKHVSPAAAADAITFTGNLATSYLDARMPDKALPLLPDFLAAKRKEFGATPRFANGLADLGLGLLNCGKFAEAEKLLRECLPIREGKEPKQWTTFNTRAMLGRCLLGQKKYAEAEPLLVEGYQGMKDIVPATARERLPEAVDALIELYTALGKTPEVEKWREVRKLYPHVAPPPRAVMK